MRTKPLKVMFDMDGVLADFIGGFTRRGHEMFGTPITHTHEQPTWDGFPGVTREQISAIWNDANGDNYFWSSLESLLTEDEATRLRCLSRHVEMYFCTSRTGMSPKRQTENWLTHRLYLSCPTVVVTSKKGDFANIIGADFSIDDKAGNAVCVAYLSPYTQSYVLDRQYNRFDHTMIGSKVQRVYRVKRYLDAIESALDNGFGK